MAGLEYGMGGWQRYPSVIARRSMKRSTLLGTVEVPRPVDTVHKCKIASQIARD